MNFICPTVLAADKADFDKQVRNVSFARRIQLDFMDGKFAPTKSISLEEAWLPKRTQSDLHLMFSKPGDHLETIFKLKPHMVIVHAEAEVEHEKMAVELNQKGILAGLCVLPETTIASVKPILKSFDHLLIFGGNLGHFGGQADLTQLSKARQAKSFHPDIEVGWDGGSNDKNTVQMVKAGVDVINVGSFIQKAADPLVAYNSLVDLVK